MSWALLVSFSQALGEGILTSWQWPLQLVNPPHARQRAGFWKGSLLESRACSGPKEEEGAVHR